MIRWPVTVAVAGGSRAHDLLQRELGERPRAVVRQGTGFFLNGDLEVRLVGSHKSSHPRKRVRGVPGPQVAVVLFAANVFLLPVKMTLQRRDKRVLFIPHTA